jgi:hypothetical protein
MNMTAARVRELQFNDEDFEWYPTTTEIIDQVANDIAEIDNDRHWDNFKSIMDIGAGDGRVLKAIQAKLETRLRTIKCYAIEKAITHLNNMPKDITVVGTDFEQQTLVDKAVDIIFCNPPYSEFEQWMFRIVREANAKLVYLVVPRRWRDSARIQHELENRSAEVESLGEFDFENADRAARCKVEVIRIEYCYSGRDAFDTAIQDMLPELDAFDAKIPEPEYSSDIRRNSRNLVDVLVEDYDAAMVVMIENYRAALKLSVEVLKELGVTKASMLENIRMKIHGLKTLFWKKLFHEMDTVTQRLATRQRNAFIESLQNKVTIDFTANNVYSILIWVSKWANDYFDEQLCELFKTLSNDSCVVRYKSNDRVWTKNGWRYHQNEPGTPSHYKLEYRVVLTHGGISTSSYDFERNGHNGLQSHAFSLLMDICTVANNLGFPCKDSPKNYQWESNKQNNLKLNNGETLVAVRAFKNGNMHLHFNPKVMLAINIEAGRLLRWIRNPAEACQEMDLQGDEAKQAARMFGSAFHISPDCGFRKLENHPENETESSGRFVIPMVS